MHQHPVLLATIVLVTSLSGSCAEDLIVDPYFQYQTLPVGLVPQQRGFQTFTELVEREGYVAEEHDVITEDGYILSIHRISGGPRSPVARGKQPVLLIHGLFAGSAIWALRGPEHDLAYLLVDNGYDVWALNSRGNYYSKRHKYLSSEDSKFWMFSWHEIGTYDIPASLDYILSLTGMPRVSLVGHSMGGTVELVLLSRRPEYNDKVNVALHFGSVTILTHNIPGLIAAISMRHEKKIEEFFNRSDKLELLPRNEIYSTFYVTLCQGLRIVPICKKLMFGLFGLTNLEEFDMSIMPHLLRHIPQGASARTILHFSQIAASGQFQEYDFGPMGNYLRYKNFTPPEYPLGNITAPIVLYYGPNDSYATEKDVQAVLKKIPSATSRVIPHLNFGHLDFIFHNETKRLLYNDVLELLNGYRVTKSNGLDSVA